MDSKRLEAVETNKHILIVVPEESIRFILSYGLQHTDKDYEVIAIGDENRALAEARRTHFDLVIFDIDILNSEAVKFTQQLQDLLQGVKIIWITSVESLAYKLQAQKMGIYHSLLKPFKLSEVRCIVQRALDVDFSS
jgi:two-component system response regulator AtoC